MATGQQRFAQQQRELAAREVPEDPTAVVTNVQPGAATDQLALVTVDYLGAPMRLRYLTSYTPVIGHVVVLGRSGGDWYIKGRMGGFPPATGGA